MKLQPITYEDLDTGERSIKFVKADREPDEEPEVIAEASTLEEYDKVAEEHELTQDARYWVDPEHWARVFERIKEDDILGPPNELEFECKYCGKHVPPYEEAPKDAEIVMIRVGNPIETYVDEYWFCDKECLRNHVISKLLENDYVIFKPDEKGRLTRIQDSNP